MNITTILKKAILMLPTLLLSLLLVPAVTFSPLAARAEHEPFTPCCKGGASPWASRVSRYIQIEFQSGLHRQLTSLSAVATIQIIWTSIPIRLLNNIYHGEAPAATQERLESQPETFRSLRRATSRTVSQGSLKGR